MGGSVPDVIREWLKRERAWRVGSYAVHSVGLPNLVKETKTVPACSDHHLGLVCGTWQIQTGRVYVADNAGPNATDRERQRDSQTTSRVAEAMRLCGYRLIATQLIDLSDLSATQRSRWFGAFCKNARK